MEGTTNLFKYSGTVTLHNFAEYMDWYNGLTYETAKAEHETFVTWVKNLLPATHIKAEDLTREQLSIRHLNDAMDKFFTCCYYCSYDNMDEKFSPIREKSLRLLAGIQSFAVDFEQPVRAAFWSDRYAFIYIGNPEKGIPVINPERYLTYIPDKDYSNITPAQMQNALCAHIDSAVDRLVPVGSEHTMTVKMAQSELSEHEEVLAQHKKRMEQTQNCESPELIQLKQQIEALKQEMYAKREELMAQLEEKMYELEETKFRLEGQIYLLDSQIYSMLCYAGETVKFAKIRSGKNAPAKEPIVIHQKLNFLDEALGRLASLYTIKWEQIDQFETFLAHHPLALETFAPNERCISLVRLSRTGRKLGMGADQFGSYNNIMESYEYYHGSTIGIIIRNGENLYLGCYLEQTVSILLKAFIASLKASDTSTFKDFISV